MTKPTVSFQMPLDDLLEQLAPLLVQKMMPLIQAQSTSASEGTEKYLTRAEVAEKLNISLSTLNKWTKDGTVTAHRIGTRVLYKEHEVEKSLSQVKTK